MRLDYIEMVKQQGREDALALREKADDMDGTELIAQEIKIPDFDPNKDYSKWAVYSPVKDENQVWQLIQPHNAKDYEGRPSTLRALWSITHTKEPIDAKPWVDPYGTSGMYMLDECYVDADGIVYRAKEDNVVHDAKARPEAWEVVS